MSTRMLFTTFLVLPLCLAIQAPAQDYSVIHSFAGDPTDGEEPTGPLLLLGSKIFGLTPEGGTVNEGVLFSMNRDGGNYQILKNFGDGINPGKRPHGGLAYNGTKLYGVTESGGIHDNGIIFSIGTDGNGFFYVHDFGTVANDGARPVGPLVLGGGKLYGATRSGGLHDLPPGNGVIFSANASGPPNYTILHNFAGQPDDGEHPAGGLTLIGNRLYGTTRRGGEFVFGAGTVFSIKTDGSGFTLLHSFDGADGAAPNGSLVSDNSTLYGVCAYGGTESGGGYYGGGGTAFSLTTGGSGFTVLHNFGEGADNGNMPYGGLTLDGDTLYSGTTTGGAVPAGAGTLFSLGTDGSGFEIIYRCDGLIEGNGSLATGGMQLDNDTLYGTMVSGGSSGNGVVFSFVPPPPSNYVNLTASPANVAVGGTVTMGWSCDFSDWNYRSVPVNVYLMAIRSPRVEDGPSSTADALAGGRIYSFGPGMASVYPGAPTRPTWSGVVFPPAPTSGSRAVSIPFSTSLAGDWVFAAAFVRSDTGAFIRTDGLPVENSNAFTIQ